MTGLIPGPLVRQGPLDRGIMVMAPAFMAVHLVQTPVPSNDATDECCRITRRLLSYIGTVIKIPFFGVWDERLRQIEHIFIDGMPRLT